MRIAVCFSGQMRTAIEASPNLFRYFGNMLPNIDFFIHTWDINQYKPYGTIPGSKEPPPWRPFGEIADRPKYYLTDREKESYQKIYQPKKMEIESYEQYESRSLNRKDSFTGALYYSWMRSVFFAVEYAHENNFRYDIVAKMRPDMLYPYIRSFEQEILNFQKNPYAFYIDNSEDIFWIASQETMLLASTFGSIELGIGCRLQQYIDERGIEIKDMIQYGYAPLRPESLQYDVLTQFPEIFNSDHYWYSCGEPNTWEGPG